MIICADIRFMSIIAVYLCAVEVGHPQVSCLIHSHAVGVVVLKTLCRVVNKLASIGCNQQCSRVRICYSMRIRYNSKEQKFDT